MTRGSPWAFDPHAVTLVVAASVGAAYLAAVRRPRWAATRRQVTAFLAGLLVIVVGVSWPIGNLAAHWSLLALVVERLVLTLAAPPLLLIGMPRTMVASATEPAPVDALVRWLLRPPVAVAVVTIVAVGTLTTPAVDEQSSSVLFRVGMDLLLLGAGFVLWAPVINVVPGTRRLPPLGTAAYLIVQSVVPSFLSLVWIFARRPLYPVFDHATRIAGMTPLLDQQLSGFVAKFLTIATLWTVAFVLVNRRDRSTTGNPEESGLTWADVSRELKRAERDERRPPRTHGWRPPP